MLNQSYNMQILPKVTLYTLMQVSTDGQVNSPSLYGTNTLQVSDKRGKLHNVHITDVRKINMTEKIAAQLQEAYNKKGRTAKHLIPQGCIPDLGWNTDQQGKERQKLPNTTPEAPVTQTMPQQAEEPPSSRLRSKSKTTTLMDPQNHNAKTMDQHNALPQVNQVHTVRKAGLDGKQL